jgi:hypothetical protein
MPSWMQFSRWVDLSFLHALWLGMLLNTRNCWGNVAWAVTAHHRQSSHNACLLSSIPCVSTVQRDLVSCTQGMDERREEIARPYEQLINDEAKAAGVSVDDWVARAADVSWGHAEELLQASAERVGMSAEDFASSMTEFYDEVRGAPHANTSFAEHVEKFGQVAEDMLSETKQQAAHRGVTMVEYLHLQAQLMQGAEEKAEALGVPVEDYKELAWAAVAEHRLRGNERVV